jgi:preprotein translocase SecE subunit
VFVVLWRRGYFLQVTKYLEETREELRKCSWPTRDELKGSTVVVMISIILLGGFTIGVDTVLWLIFRVISEV